MLPKSITVVAELGGSGIVDYRDVPLTLESMLLSTELEGRFKDWMGKFMQVRPVFDNITDGSFLHDRACLDFSLEGFRLAFDLKKYLGLDCRVAYFDDFAFAEKTHLGNSNAYYIFEVTGGLVGLDYNSFKTREDFLRCM